MAENSLELKLILDVVKELKLTAYVNEIYIASYDENISTLSGTKWIDRNKSIFNDDNINIEKLLSLSLIDIESKGFFEFCKFCC